MKVLATASHEDVRSLNDALLKIRGTLENFVRLELAVTGGLKPRPTSCGSRSSRHSQD